MRTREALTISMPPEMLKEVERVRKLEHRTRSELMREALRTYFSGRRVREALASPEEIRAIRRGRAEIRQGKYVTLDQLLDEMGRPRRRKSKKSA
jgi:predicted transcriptional regulator